MENEDDSLEKILIKLKSYCAYQERSSYDVNRKLASFELSSSQVNYLMEQLIASDFLNEERFARQFAGGKFRMNQWGRIKIRYALRKIQINESLIKK